MVDSKQHSKKLFFIVIILLTVVGGFFGGILSQLTMQETTTVKLRENIRKDGGARPDTAIDVLPTVTNGIDPILGIPAVVHRPNNSFLQPYSPTWKGLTVKYVGDIFKGRNQDMLYSPAILDGRVLLPWQTSVDGAPGLYGIYPGNTLTFLDNNLYDLGLGLLFGKVSHDAVNLEGYVPLNVLLGECDMANTELWVAKDIDRLLKETTVMYQGMLLYAVDLGNDQNKIQSVIDLMGDSTRYNELKVEMSGDHPLFATSQLLVLLFVAAREETPEDLRKKIISVSKLFFDEYIIPKQVALGHDFASWPFGFEWITNWGVRLDIPWYSPYTNAYVANAAAFMYRFTNDERYKDIAEKAIRYIGTCWKKGGAEYEVSGFRLPAEYVYKFDETPNIRVLDGELLTIVYTYNAARLLGNWNGLQISVRQAMSIAMQLPLFTKSDGSLLFAMYIEEMPKHYQWVVWSCLQVLANIMKDRRFVGAARALEPHIPEYWRGIKPM